MPAHHARAAGATTPPPHSSPREAATDTPIDRPARVLLVEDEAVVAMVLEEALERAGHDVVTAPDPDAAIAAWEAAEAAGMPIGMLVTNLSSPQGGPFGGVSLIRHLRAQRRGLPVVVVTGHELTDAELRSRLGRRDAGRRGETVLLRKPFDLGNSLPEALSRANTAAMPRRFALPARTPDAGTDPASGDPGAARAR
jgi:CheY-like chemotaxis protein